MITKSKKPLATSTRYIIDLKDKALLDIMAKDANIEFGLGLWSIVGAVDGVRDVDYDGHFGNHIYIELNADHDTKATWKLIYDLINNYL